MEQEREAVWSKIKWNWMLNEMRLVSLHHSKCDKGGIFVMKFEVKVLLHSSHCISHFVVWLPCYGLLLQAKLILFRTTCNYKDFNNSFDSSGYTFGWNLVPDSNLLRFSNLNVYECESVKMTEDRMRVCCVESFADEEGFTFNDIACRIYLVSLWGE